MTSYWWKIFVERPVQLDTARSSEGAGRTAVPFTCLERALERAFHLLRFQALALWVCNSSYELFL